MIKKKRLSPQEATTFKKRSSLKKQSARSGNYLLHAGNKIWICNGKKGEGYKKILSIPRKDFNRLIKFYQTKQTVNG